MNVARTASLRGSPSFASASYAAPLFAALCFLSGCTNNFSIGRGTGNTSIVASNPNINTSNNSGGAFTLSRVVRNTLDPQNTLDLIGTGGEFGNLCIPSNTGGSSGASTGSTSPTVCSCSFAYSSPRNLNQQVDFPVTYHEADLLRCNYSALPTNVTSVRVSVHLTSAGTFSNAITLPLNNTGISNPSDPANFSLVTRYQCRDIVVIPFMLDSSVYDPLQSEDFRLTYPLDFYTTNIGNAISSFVKAAAADPNLAFWNCPPILNPTDFLRGAERDNFTAVNHINLKIYSKADPGDGGGKLIFPHTGGFDRSTFYLSRTTAGVFNVPVNAYQSPGVITANGTANPSLGFGAEPISQGVGRETCPDTSVVIPAGFHWVKVWLFRATLPQRQFATSTDITNTQSVTCNPGIYETPGQTGAASMTPVFASCDRANSFSFTTKGGGGASNGGIAINSTATQTSTNHYLADRVLGTGQCVQLDGGGALHPNSCTANAPGVGCNAADFWSCNDVTATSCPAASSDFMGVTTSIMGAITNPLTKTDLGIGQLDVGASRYDFLFVVTPPSISLEDMQDISPSSISLPYQPFRFYTDADCSLDDPDGFSTIANDCNPANIISTYGLKLHDVGTLGDPPAGDVNRPGVFPVCALQPD